MTLAVTPKIDASWKAVLADEFAKPYFPRLKAFLLEEKSRYTVYPAGPNIFNAFNTTPFERVKVVILGQDPYHGPGQAHGLASPSPRRCRTSSRSCTMTSAVPTPKTAI